MATPYDAELEKAVLSACLMNRRCLDVALEIDVDEDCFFSEGFQAVWRGLMRLHANPPDTPGTEGIDPLLLWEVIKRDGNERIVGGLPVLAEIASTVATTAPIRAHCTCLVQYRVRRELQRLGQDLISRSEDSTHEPLDVIQAADEALLMYRTHNEHGLLSMEQAMADTSDYIASNAVRHDLLGVSTGCYDLDSLTNGFKAGELIILAGRPSQGKSALAWQIAEWVARKHGPVAFFSLEMDAKQLILRSLARYLKKEAKEIAQGRIPDDLQPQFRSACTLLSELPLYIDHRGGLTAQQLRARTRLLHRKRDLKLIVVDYMQLMAVPKAANREQEVSAISRGMKALAMDLQVPLLAVAQLNRQIEYRHGANSRPQLSDLRDSGQIEQDADIVAFIYHPSKHGIKGAAPNEVEVILRKQRNGPLGTAHMLWDTTHASFSNLETHHAA